MTGKLNDGGSGDIFSAVAEAIWSTPAQYGVVPARETSLLRENYPEWCDAFEDCVLDTADIDQLEELVRSAPTDYACGVIYGIILMRIQMALMAGRQIKWDPESPMETFDDTFNPASFTIKAPNYGERQAAEMLKLRRRHMDWYVYLEECVVEFVSRADLEEILHSAPTPFAVGIVYGIIVMRVYVGMLTGVEFA